MYHTTQINQASIHKNLSSTRFFHKDLQFAHYIDGLSPKLRKVAQVYISHIKLPWIKLTNERVALLAGCSQKTVTRATNKFHEDGFIAKHQDNKYAPNHYTFNDKVKKSTFSHWFNTLSAKNQDLYISHGIRIDHKNRIIFSHENVPQIKSNLILDSLSSKNVIVSSRTGAKDRIHIQNKSNQKKGKIVNSVQKQLILDNRHDPLVKDMLNNPDIMEHIITPIIQKITALLTLDEKEQFKLTAFTDETLQYVYEKIQPAIVSKQVPHIANRMEWVIAFATQYCTDNEINPDWKWYYDLCDILGINPVTDKKPLTISRPRQQDASWKTGEWHRTAQIAALEARAEKWKLEVRKMQARLDILTGPDPLHFKGLLTRSINNAKQELMEAETALRSSNENQEILHQRSPYSMAACNA